MVLDWSDARFPHPEVSPEILKHRWVILFALETPCLSECLEKVSMLRQVHRASGRNQDRIEIVLLSAAAVDKSTREQLLAIYNRFLLAVDVNHEIQLAIATAAQQASLTTGGQTSYLVDPLGNIMMAYDTPDSDARMSKDLKKLLTWSKQDKG